MVGYGVGKELVKDTCASGDARLSDAPSMPSVEDPPFNTLEPDGVVITPLKALKPPSALTPEQEGWFTTWWSGYWLHKARKAAREAFRKHVGTEARFQQVMSATKAQAPEMLARESSKRPHGATWLNGERWEDETARAAQQQAESPYRMYQPPKRDPSEAGNGEENENR